jgi:hypothetical protein
VAELIEGDQARFDAVFAGLQEPTRGSERTVVTRYRKRPNTRPNADSTQGSTPGWVAAIEQREVQWHVAQMLPRRMLSCLDVINAVRP